MIIIIEIFAIILLILVLLMFIPWKFGAPFQSSSRKRINKMINIADIKKSEKAVDVGSGTGEIVIALAKNKNISEVHGYEINPILAYISKLRIKKLNLQNKAFIHRKNFWKADLKDFDIITIFQINFVMPKLAEKIKSEAKNTVKIISNTWKFPDWKPVKKDNGVYLYKKN